jgi:hypothetical protein
MATEQREQQAASFSPGQATPKVVSGDLSAEIAATIDRDPGDRVRVTHIGGDSYRCNWWAPGDTAAYDNPTMYGLVVTTHVVRKSQFLSVSKVGDRLLIRHPSRAGTSEIRERVKG